MDQLPSSKTPLNQHSLDALELWLRELGAEKSSSDPTVWSLGMPTWSAEIQMGIENLRITWEKNGSESSCSFPYGLSREDVQVGICQGP
ncbi:DUF3143 domain-containing protein [Prochlorococcus sp. MIT 1223]|uniref:DUF3143 domain-containing protein n=1 Tax=Prochlorococcus sp. MIT 1223 TaxID=3096217 RepID=UPI002A7571C6|nr:DUF3143 domain-containing protein [Prochlorococcus sp. MIT 1223]